MQRRQAKHIFRELTPDERARVAGVREKIESAEKAEILGKARRYKREYDESQAALHEAFQLLKAERVSQGLSLGDMEQRTGIARGNLSRLENETAANPTIATLTRYADALGKKLQIVLTDK